jgi:very-short-patch-repair endonuclease
MEQKDYDAGRTAFLKSLGYRVLRFWNGDVLNNLDAVLLAIAAALDER